MVEQNTREVLALRSLHSVIERVNAGQDLAEVLHLIAQGVVDVLGFQIAVISRIVDGDTLIRVAVAGSDDARATLLHRRTPVAEVLAEFALCDHWGILRFLPHDRLPEEAGIAWIPDITPLDVPNAWHPLDTLYAPLNSPTGEMLGVLSVDLPQDGLRPSRLRRQVLEMFAVQAGLAMYNAQQRERLLEQLRLSAATRAVVNTAGRELDLDRVLDACVRPLSEGFRAEGLWVRSFALEGDPDDLGHGASYPPLPEETLLAMQQMAPRVAALCWDRQRELVVEVGDPSRDDGLLTLEEQDLVKAFLGATGRRSALCVPLGAGPDCLGYIVMVRDVASPRWSTDEVEAALEIGRDLGRAVMQARVFARERHLVGQLQALDQYKRELIATISHELKNPLTSILGHVERLEDEGAPMEPLRAIDRNTHRLKALVEDLLTLAKVEDPNQPFLAAPVDLTVLLDDALDMFSVQAGRREVTLKSETPDGPVLAWGDRDELACLLDNLIGNAIKYSRPGGAVEIHVLREDDAVVLECRDNGMGISQEDQVTLFAEFTRSSNPEAMAEPGTGLGLAIVHRIVTRHAGTITVESELGTGSVFRVALPTSDVA